MSMLRRDQVLQAAHELYCTSVQSHLSERRIRNPYPQDWEGFTRWVERLPDCDQLATTWRLLGRVEQAWGYDVGLVIHHMGIPAERQSDVIYYLLLGCAGCGLGVDDHFSEELERAGDILLRHSDRTAFDATPFTFEEVEWREAAESAFPAGREDE